MKKTVIRSLAVALTAAGAVAAGAATAQAQPGTYYFTGYGDTRYDATRSAYSQAAFLLRQVDEYCTPSRQDHYRVKGKHVVVLRVLCQDL